MATKNKVLGIIFPNMHDEAIPELNEINDDIIEELVKPVLLKNKLVFEKSAVGYIVSSALPYLHHE